MANYHAHISLVSRAKNHSAVGKLAYNHAEELVNKYDGEVFDYTYKKNVQGNEFMKSENCPFETSYDMFQDIELSEKNRNIQLAREIEISIPVEYMRKDGTIEERGKQVARDFAKEMIDKYGFLAVDISFHSPPKAHKENGRKVIEKDENGNMIFQNPHAHILMQTKEYDIENRKWKEKSQKEYLWTDGKKEIYSANYPGKDEDIFKTWSKAQSSRAKEKADVQEPEYKKVLNENGNVKSKRVNVGAWDYKDFVKQIREMWEKTANRFLEKDGYKKISCKSYEEQGIQKQPQIHLSRNDWYAYKAGQTNERIKQYMAIEDYNKARLEYVQLANKIMAEVKVNQLNSFTPNHEVKLEDVPKPILTEKQGLKLLTKEELIERQNDLLLERDHKREELDNLKGFFNGIFKSEQKKAIEEEIQKINQKVDKISAELKNRREKENRLDRMNEQMKTVKPMEKVTEERQAQVEQIKQFNQQLSQSQEQPSFKGYDIKPKEWKHNDMSKGAKGMKDSMEKNLEKAQKERQAKQKQLQKQAQEQSKPKTR